jgi:hypothetical protein
MRALTLSLVGTVAVTAAAEDYCVQYVPLRDDWGSLIGRRPVREC